MRSVVRSVRVGTALAQCAALAAALFAWCACAAPAAADADPHACCRQGRAFVSAAPDACCAGCGVDRTPVRSEPAARAAALDPLLLVVAVARFADVVSTDPAPILSVPPSASPPPASSPVPLRI